MHLLEPGRVGGRVETGRLLGVGHSEQQPGPFAMEVEAGREVDRERDSVGEPGVGPVNPTSRRYGSTGSSTPAVRAISGDQTPAAQTTVPVSIVPRDVSTPRISSPSRSTCGDRAAGETDAPCARAPAAYPCTTASGLAWPSSAQYVGGENPVEPGERAQLAHLGEIDEAARNSELVLQRDARLEGGDVLLAVEKEQVADLVQVDLGARVARRSG